MSGADKYWHERLTYRLDEIESRIEKLVDIIAPSASVPIVGLSPSQMIIISYLRKRAPGIVKITALLQLLDTSGAPYSGMTTDETLKVQICKMRKKLKGTGIDVKNQPRVGYWMPSESAQAFDRLVEEQ